MNPQKVGDILNGRQRGAGAACLRGCLLAASWPYAAAMCLRRQLYGWGVLASKPAKVPVISVGNLTTGGTGKTPMAAWIAERLKKQGAKPAILTRGYKAKGGKSDEAELLKTLTGCPVVIDTDRVAAAAAAVEGGADVLIMDDGFQHRRLRRELDIVLIDATNAFGYGHCLPRGLLRELPSALRDVDVVVITRSDAVEAERLQELRGRLAHLAPKASLHAAVHKPGRIIDEHGDEMPLKALEGRAVFAFCGIGNPESFFRLLGKLNARVVSRRTFDDHVAYTPEIVESLGSEARRCRAEILISTQKDLVKLADAELDGPLWQLAVEIAVTQGGAELLEKIQKTWKAD